MKKLVLTGLIAATCFLIGALVRARREVTVVVDGVALWNRESALVIVTSKNLAYRGSVLNVFWSGLRQTFGIPSPASTVSLESSVLQVHAGRMYSSRHEGGLYRVAVIQGAILAQAGAGEIVRVDLERDTIRSATADERNAYLRNGTSRSEATWSMDDGFLGSTAASTTMSLADSRYHVSSSRVGRRRIYQVFGQGVSAVVATVDEEPHWYFEP